MTKEELSSIIVSSMSEALDFHRQKEEESYGLRLKARDEFIMEKLNDCSNASRLYFWLTLIGLFIGLFIVIANS